MSEEPTENLPDQRSFEERVFARFDAMDARFDAMDARFEAMDTRFEAMDTRFEAIDSRLERLEARKYDTKPIWERALKAINETGLEVGEIKTRVGAIEDKIGVVENKIQLLEKEVAAMKITFRNELVDIRRDLRHNIRDGLDLISKYLHENREDIRDAEERIRELESKFG